MSFAGTSNEKVLGDVTSVLNFTWLCLGASLMHGVGHFLLASFCHIKDVFCARSLLLVLAVLVDACFSVACLNRFKLDIRLEIRLLSNKQTVDKHDVAELLIF